MSLTCSSWASHSLLPRHALITPQVKCRSLFRWFTILFTITSNPQPQSTPHFNRCISHRLREFDVAGLCRLFANQTVAIKSIPLCTSCVHSLHYLQISWKGTNIILPDEAPRLPCIHPLLLFTEGTVMSCTTRKVAGLFPCFSSLKYPKVGYGTTITPRRFRLTKILIYQ